MKESRFIILGIAAAAMSAALIGCGGGTARIQSSEEAATAPIVFTADNNGQFDIYTMRADGTGIKNVTNNPAQDSVGTFTANANEIVFVSDRDGNQEMYKMNPDGSNVQRLTNDPGIDKSPSLAMNDDLFFTSTRDGSLENPQIYLIRHGTQTVTKMTTANAPHYDPVVDPLGGNLVYASRQNGVPGLFRCTAIPSSTQLGVETRLTSEDDESPAWSPDSTKIAFVRVVGQSTELFMMNSDGGGVERLTNDIATEYTPWFTSDGKALLFVSDLYDPGSNKYDVYRMDLATKQVTRVDTLPNVELHPRVAVYTTPSGH